MAEKILLLDLWASWCRPCLQKSREGEILAIEPTADEVRKILEEKRISKVNR